MFQEKLFKNQKYEVVEIFTLNSKNGIRKVKYLLFTLH